MAQTHGPFSLPLILHLPLISLDFVLILCYNLNTIKKDRIMDCNLTHEGGIPGVFYLQVPCTNTLLGKAAALCLTHSREDKEPHSKDSTYTQEHAEDDNYLRFRIWEPAFAEACRKVWEQYQKSINDKLEAEERARKSTLQIQANDDLRTIKSLMGFQP